MSDLHWCLRDHLQEFRTDGRLFVLLSIYLHKNTRNRSWPSNELIRKETGLSRAPVSQSVQWLIDHKAVVLVPYDKRVGKETKLAKRKNIYQLTGLIEINGKFIPYLFMNPESWRGIADELNVLGNSSISELLQDESLISELSRSELSNFEPKGIKSSSSEGSKPSKGKKEKKKSAPLGAKPSSKKKPDFSKPLKDWTWEYIEQYACDNPTIEFVAAFYGLGNTLKSLPTTYVARDAIEAFRELTRLKVPTDRWKSVYDAASKIKHEANIFKRILWALPKWLKSEPNITVVNPPPSSAPPPSNGEYIVPLSPAQMRERDARLKAEQEKQAS
jgi:hypothetical protein